jgi:hypothetical protein
VDGKPRKIELYVERYARHPLSFRSEARNLFLPQHNAASNSRFLNGYRRFGMTKQQNPQRLIAVFGMTNCIGEGSRLGWWVSVLTTGASFAFASSSLAFPKGQE